VVDDRGVSEDQKAGDGVSEKGSCVAPGCGAETPSRYDYLCDPDRTKLEAAQVEARPALLEAMRDARLEVERWMASDWSSPRRWVLTNEEYEVLDLVAESERLAGETAEEWGQHHLGFVDDPRHERSTALRKAATPESPPRELQAWIVASDSDVTGQWRTHLAPFLRAALKEALATFPLSGVGHEIKTHIREASQHGDDHGAFDELWEGSGQTGLSEDALDWLAIRYYPSATWCADSSPDSTYWHLWMRYRVLPDDIMAIMDAADAAFKAHER
jgi:hypothetical protein